MKISVLTDNYPGPHTPAEHGLSYFIEYDGKRLIFDTGQTDMFLRNAEVMKINMKNIDAVILSHGHFDHGNGLEFLNGCHLICHPGCGHSGLVNTVEHAKKVSGIRKILGVMGGFYLKGNGLRTRETIRYLQENQVPHVLPSHCNDLSALSAFYQSFGFEQVKTGYTYEF
jgi:metal-dependent hydrolase (beta-lactamase superfamily II)